MVSDFESDKILKQSQENVSIAERLFDVEKCILAQTSFTEFFEKLLLTLEERFFLPFVWLSLIKGRDTNDIVTSATSPHVERRINVITETAFQSLVGTENTPRLINHDIDNYFTLLPKKNKILFKSIAIIPISFHHTIIGSLNLGDYSESRFVPSMDTYFLTQLGVKISLCLDNVAAHEALAYLSTRDALTGLLNRREMEKMLEKEHSRSIRYGIPLSLLFIDCNGLKSINDEYGHECGDSALQALSQHFTAIIRKDDMVFRYGGDEFIILLPHQGTKDARAVARRLIAFVADHPLLYQSTTIPLSVSCGVSSTEMASVSTSQDLLTAADKNLYTKKRGQKTAVRSDEADAKHHS